MLSYKHLEDSAIEEMSNHQTFTATMQETLLLLTRSCEKELKTGKVNKCLTPCFNMVQRGILIPQDVHIEVDFTKFSFVL